MTIRIRNDGTTTEVDPLSVEGQTIEEFYDYGKYGHPHSHTSTGIERGDVSALFVYQDPDGSRSIVMLHDDRYDSGGGEATLEFDSLPENGEWALRDDDPGNDTYDGTERVHWIWGSRHTDGAAYRAEFGDGTEIEITPRFHSGIDEWHLLSGDAADPERTVLDSSSSVTIEFGSGTADVRADAATLTLLPGFSEDSSLETDPEDLNDDGGDDLDSAMPDYFGESLDAWFIADQITDLPDSQEEAEAIRRHLPEYDEGLRQYRMKNEVSISFDTDDDTSVDWDTVSVSTTEQPPSYVAVEGQPGEENFIRNIVESDDIDWFDGEDKLRADTANKRFESEPQPVTVDNVEGVRATVIYGGSDTYITRLKERLADLGPLEFIDIVTEYGWSLANIPAFIAHPPIMYTFVDVIAMADETVVVRTWDASRYPKHYLYVNGWKRDETEFEPGPNARFGDAEWGENQDIPPQRFNQWVAESQDQRTPFHFRKGYESWWDSIISYGSHPVMTHGEDGDILTAATVREASNVQFPWN